MTNKRIIAMGLALVLLVSLFTACGKKDVAEEETTTSELTTLAAAEESASEETTTVEAEPALDPAAPEKKDVQINNDEGSGNQAPAKSAANTASPKTPGAPATKAPGTTKAPEAPKPTQAQDILKETEPHNFYNPDWTQTQVNAFVSKSRAYGESIGLVWDDTFDLTNSSWQTSIDSRYSGNTEEEVLTKMKLALDSTKNRKQANYFKLWVEHIDGSWEFTILWM